jgi:hypothetical protein
MSGSPSSSSPPPWWTSADAAELDVLVWKLVSDYSETHRPRCGVCRAGYPPCPQLREAVEAVVDWLTGRSLRSRAEWLREKLDDFEAELRARRREAAA